ncbi:uncharacterized protein DUF4825 [Kineothrix alysoides]|uniref:Uncharacterized protein DUF4825 n=1 Tax=Kineothrix alysoides TaxID=1469948 RepID=A0A4R1R4L1_9FIRM|nr:DUF5301 domain-containing protein [Kineothrix alysoides]TCL60358.1 uncharacterized protein DUF4825 [Kineothrix alysoides]
MANKINTPVITLFVIMIMAVAAAALIFGGAARKVPVPLPQSSEVMSITIEQINEGESSGTIHISQKTDVEAVLNVLANTDKTLQQSVNDAPNRNDYFQINIESINDRRFYLYNDNEKYYIEEPYAGIYKTTREAGTAIVKIYTANSGVSINAQELWKSRTPYVGDSSAVGKLLSLLPLPGGLLHDHFELRTTGNERGVEWILIEEDNTSYSLRQLDKNALLLFALIDNLEDFYVTIGNLSDDDTVYHYTRQQADELVGSDVRKYAESPEQIQILIDFPIAETPLYSMAKLENGKIISEYPLESSELADTVIMDVMVKSAAWEGIDISTLKECFQIHQTFPEANESHDFYAYLLEDGRAVLQSGKDGWYSILSQELYSELSELWSNLTAGSLYE